jgi:F0F1-type ATP synthase membrane subunit c/vacuolar-type H+-ATPase subunit K
MRMFPLVPLVATLVLWAPIRDNYFIGDDFDHLYDAATLPLQRHLLQLWSGHLCIVPNAVLAALFRMFGPDARPYFTLVLVTHAVNVVLLERVVRRLTSDALIACFGATLWGTCPALRGALGWYSVYGQVLLTAMVFGVLASLARVRLARGEVSTGTAAAWGAVLAAGGATFGTGLGVAAAAPVVAVLALPRVQRRHRSIAVLALVVLATFAIYALVRAEAPPSPIGLESPSLRAMIETVPAAIAFQSRLIAIGSDLLWLRFLGKDAAANAAMAWLARAAFAGVVLGAWLFSPRDARRLLLALAVLVVAAYGAVALGRTEMLQRYAVPLSVAAAWWRYHYLPLALLAVLACAALAALGARAPIMRRVSNAMIVLWFAARLTVLATSPLPIDHHPDARAAAEAARSHIEAAVAAAPAGRTVLIQNRRFQPVAAIPGYFPGLAGFFVVYFPENEVHGRPVRFVVSPDEWTKAQSRGGRLAALVVQR